MSVYRQDIVDINLDSGTVYRSFMNKAVGEGDENGNRFGFRCLRAGSPILLNGCTVIGHFIRADGVTITINGGAVVGEVAYVALPASCYAVEGNFELAIKIIGGGVTATARIVDGTVVNTTLGTVIDPGSAVPDISSLLAVISAAEDAADTINSISITAVLIENDDYNIVITKS